MSCGQLLDEEAVLKAKLDKQFGPQLANLVWVTNDATRQLYDNLSIENMSDAVLVSFVDFCLVWTISNGAYVLTPGCLFICSLIWCKDTFNIYKIKSL